MTEASGVRREDNLAGAPVTAMSQVAGRDGGSAATDSEVFERIIQRVFTAGMLLNRALHGSTPDTALSIEQAICELDGVLGDIRGAALVALARATRDPELRPAQAEFDVAVESLDEVAAAITRLMVAQLLDGSCAVHLIDAAHSAHRARLAVEDARSAQTGRRRPSPNGAGEPSKGARPVSD